MSFRPGQLRYFVTVAETGQITRAARQLHIAQPALSQALAQLEAQLGVKLLDRHARGVTLTAAGEAFLTKARAVLRAEADAAATARSLARITDGSIELGFLGTPPMVAAPELFVAFKRVYPQVEVTFASCSSRRARRLLGWRTSTSRYASRRRRTRTSRRMRCGRSRARCCSAPSTASRTPRR